MELLDKPVTVTHSTVAFLLVLTGTTAGFDQREQRELKPLKYCHGHFLLFNNLVFIIQLLHFISGEHLAKNILVFENNVQNQQQHFALPGLGLGGGEGNLQQPGPLEHGADGLGEHREHGEQRRGLDVVQLRQLPQLPAARLLGQRSAVAVVVEARQPVVDHPSPNLAQSFSKHPKYFMMKKYLFNYLVLVVASAARLAGVAVFERPGHELGDGLLHLVTGHGGERRLVLVQRVVQYSIVKSVQ